MLSAYSRQKRVPSKISQRYCILLYLHICFLDLIFIRLYCAYRCEIVLRSILILGFIQMAFEISKVVQSIRQFFEIKVLFLTLSLSLSLFCSSLWKYNQHLSRDIFRVFVLYIVKYESFIILSVFSLSFSFYRLLNKNIDCKIYFTLYVAIAIMFRWIFLDMLVNIS